MRSFFLITAAAALVPIFTASVPPKLAQAHEDHNVKCNETAVNALEADIQSMSDGDAKDAASEDLAKARKMMSKKDLEGCEAHMHKAMEKSEE
jgi:hypothetical protein